MKKKKGSSLIFVLVTFSIITTFGFAVLSLTLISYQKRFVEATEKRSQYFSESGLDVTYGIIGNIVDEAIIQGNTAVATYMNYLNGENGIIQQEKEKLKNAEKPNFPRQSDNMKSVYIQDDGITVDEDYIKQQQNNEFQKRYKEYVVENIKDNWKLEDNESAKDKDLTRIIPMSNDDYRSKYENQNQGIIKPIVKIYNKDNENSEVQVAFNEVKNYRNTGKNQCILPLYLRSNFTEKNVRKTIVVGYDIVTPNYNAPYYVSGNKFEWPSVWNNKAFCIDGDLKIRGNFNVNGDIYVKGNDTDTGYEGINVINYNNSGVTFTGNVSTSKNFKISKPEDSVTVPNIITVTNSIYAGGNVEVEEGADGSTLSVTNSIYTNNDLALDAKSSSASMANFYGISDIPEVKGNNEKKVSSCIRVNAEDVGTGSSVTISSDAILMGAAYIKTNDKTDPFYQTGESVSIRGNYRAYTKYLTSEDAERKNEYYGNDPKNPKRSLKKENVVIEYKDPLQLVTKYIDGTSLDEQWQDKSDYFTLYVNEHKNDVNNGLNLGAGITLPMDNSDEKRPDKNIVHKGAIIAGGNVYNGNYQPLDYSEDGTALEYEKKIAEKQRDFTRMVYEMGDSKDLDTVYAQGKVVKSVYSSNPDVAQINFDKISNTIGNEVTKNSNSDIIYLNNDIDKDCVIVGKGAVNIPSGVQIKLDSEGEGRGIIITRGNVYLCGEIKFTGLIISAGNAKVKDDKEKHFTSDNNYIRRLISCNYEKCFKDVFSGTSVDSQYIQAGSEITTDTNIKSDIIRNNFIIMGNWKIEK